MACYHRYRLLLNGQQIRTTTMTRLALSDVHDEVTTGFSTLAGSVVASERNITSTIEEIRTLGVRQSEDVQNLSARLQGSRQRGLYKGSVCNFQSSHSCHSPFTGMGYHSRRHPHNRTSDSFIDEIPYH